MTLRDRVIHAQYQDLETQVRVLADILRETPLWGLFEDIKELGLPEDSWYIAAGAIYGPIWNVLHEQPLMHGVRDVDVAYFDPDISYEAEDLYIRRAKELFGGRVPEVEIRNQARVHLWYPKYPEHYRQDIAPFTSTEAAIATWQYGSGAVGVRVVDGRVIVCAPYGLSDLFGMRVRPNKQVLTQLAYENKAAYWQTKWPEISVAPWDDLSDS